MPDPFFAKRSSARGAGDPFFAPRSPGGQQLPSLDDLRAQVSELELAQQATGARGIEQEGPGALSRIIDVLSRPNYAVAGFAEEVLGEQPSVARGVKRSLAEIFSGVGGIKGEKRAFGEVMENLGVGTKTLADAFPALENTWVGNFGSRGAAGLALDIALDPLTYMTFGAGTGARIALKGGKNAFLNKAGREAYGELFRKNMALARPAAKGADPVATTRLWTRVTTATEDEFERLFAQSGKVADEFLEPGGAKLFGAKIPGSDKLGVPLRKAMEMLPESVARPAIEGAEQMHQGMKRMVNGIFSAEGALANLPDPLRTRAVRLTNDFFRSSSAHRGMLMARMDPLERLYRKLERSDKLIGERWYDIREGVKPISAITNADELAAFKETMKLYDEMGATLLEHGVLGDAQILPNYIFHQYKNVDDLAQYHPRPGVKLDPNSKANFEKMRKFESFREAQDVTKDLHRTALQYMSRGEAKRLYPELVPDFDVFSNMRKYIGQHADALGRKAWREEMVETFGKQLDEFDFDALYDDATKGVRPGTGKGAPKDFNPERVPLVRSIDEGEVEKALEGTFGADGAQYVAVKGKITNDELVYLPKAIAKDLERVHASLFRTEEYKEFSKLLKGFDWLNNNFKWGVYTIWPASAFRDAYSNVALSMLRVGTNALDPKRHADAILMMAGRNMGKEFAGSGYTIGQLRDLSKTFRVWVPGQVFVEQTGKFKLGRARRALTEARAGIENEARVMLWLDEIRRGVDPRKAADTVGEFLFNYGEVSRVERDLFRRLIPFYTFTRKNVELQWKMLRRNPGMQINQLKPLRGRTEENEQMVKWEAEGLKLRLDGDGKTVHVLTGIDLPLRNLDTIWAGGVGPTGRRMMGMMSPVLKVPLEVLAGKDLFTGGDMKRTRADTLGRIVEATHTPQAVRNWLGYKKEHDQAGRPRYTMDGQRYALLVRSWMFSRGFSTTDRVFREYTGDPDISRALLDVLTGVRRKDLDMTEEQERKLRRRIRQLEDSLVRRGVRREFSRTFVPKEDQ